MRPFLTAIAAAALASGAWAQCVNFGAGFYGCGSSTPFGIPMLMCAGSPTVGNAAFSVTTGVPCLSSAPLLVIGPCQPAPVLIPGPFGNGGFCGPSMAPCMAAVGPAIFGILVGAILTPPNIWTFALPIPNDPTLQGANVCIQEANVCPLFPSGQCIAVSPGISVTVL
jgi:hypothetical protein